MPSFVLSLGLQACWIAHTTVHTADRLNIKRGQSLLWSGPMMAAVKAKGSQKARVRGFIYREA